MTLDDFLSCFFPTKDEPIYLRGLAAKGMPPELGAPPYGQRVTREELKTNKVLQKKLIDLNQTQGLYFAPNSGGLKYEEINRFNAIFCEIDDIPIQQQLDLYDYGPLAPTICVETKKSIHTYWVLEDKDITAEQWVGFQTSLIEHFKGDAGIKNPNRVMRLPYFKHVRWDGALHYKKVDIVRYQPTFTYTIEEIEKVFPIKEINIGESFTNSNKDANIHDKLKYKISQHSTYKVERDGVHATCQGICHNARVGKTAIMVNLRSGAVFCHAGCDYWRIASAFGISKPSPDELKVLKRPRKDQLSETAKFLRNHVYGE